MISPGKVPIGIAQQQDAMRRRTLGPIQRANTIHAFGSHGECMLVVKLVSLLPK